MFYIIFGTFVLLYFTFRDLGFLTRFETCYNYAVHVLMINCGLTQYYAHAYMNRHSSFLNGRSPYEIIKDENENGLDKVLTLISQHFEVGSF